MICVHVNCDGGAIARLHTCSQAVTTVNEQGLSLLQEGVPAAAQCFGVHTSDTGKEPPEERLGPQRPETTPMVTQQQGDLHTVSGLTFLLFESTPSTIATFKLLS